MRFDRIIQIAISAKRVPTRGMISLKGKCPVQLERHTMHVQHQWCYEIRRCEVKLLQKLHQTRDSGWSALRKCIESGRSAFLQRPMPGSIYSMCNRTPAPLQAFSLRHALTC